MIDSILRTSVKGATGIVAAATAEANPILDALPDAFRDPVKVLAMAVSLAMFVSICFDIYKKWRHRNDP